jgi:hypothetical protein
VVAVSAFAVPPWEESAPSEWNVREDLLADVTEYEYRPPMEASETTGRKSSFLAAGLSLLVPGGGQFYLGEKNRAGVYFGIEVVSWGTFVAFRTYANWKEDDYYAFAALHADADVSGKPESYMEDLTYYDNVYEFNEWALWDTRDPSQMYPTTDEWFWDWDSDGSRDAYRDLRNDAKSARRKSLYTLGVMGLVRLVSAFDAFRLAKSHNASLDREWLGGVRVAPTYDPGDGSIGLSLSARF